MKKFVKVMLILAAVLTAVGIGLTAAGAAMGAGAQGAEVMRTLERRFGDTFGYFDYEEWGDDFGIDETKAEVDHYVGDLDEDDFKNDRDDDFDNADIASGKNLEAVENGGSRIYQADAAENLDINLKYDELILKEHDGEGILVEVQNDPMNLVHVKVSGNTLKITSSKKLEKKRRVMVSYPKNMNFHEVELGVGAGNVEVNGNLNADSLDVTMGAGEFTNQGTITARKTELEVGAGDMAVSELTTEELDGQCGVGDLSIEMNGKKSDFSYSLECGIGNITLGDENYSGFGKEKKINNPGAKGEIDLECGIGDISITFTEK